MTHPWRPEDQEEDELELTFAQEREAWRGEVHLDAEPWRAGPGEDPWRGGEHFADWPEASAGPEYWMYKGASPEA
jgi:hypothetical protein